MPSQAISLIHMLLAAKPAEEMGVVEQSTSGLMILAIVLALLILPFIIGGYLARRLRMPDHGWKIGLILCTIACASTITYYGWPPNLGPDLQGGVILIYEIDQTKKEDPNQKVDMEKLINALMERINPGGQKEVIIRQCGDEQIEIIVPEIKDEVEARRFEAMVTRAGTLEFRILANRKDHGALIQRALAEDTTFLKNSKDELEAYWVPVKEGREDDLLYGEIARRPRPGNEEVTEILVIQPDDYEDVNGGFLVQASPDTDQHGERCVRFVFNAVGAQRFGALTSNNLPDTVQEGYTRKLGIVLDGQLYSAPAIQSAIFGVGQITGNFSKEEVEEQVTVLNAGALPAALAKEPISRLFTGPMLGQDTIRKGSFSIGISMVLVLLFMLFYYRFSGMIACMALLMNLILILGVMIAVKAAFTLPGLAGLVLTVGMAVDANVLIFERIREELSRGAALRMAIRNGFGRATTTIVDANLTTLITATVLWAIGTDQIRGFAVILWLGVVMSMYTAIFCSRVIFDIAEKHRWITELKMMHLIGKTKIDFIGMRRVAAVVSVIVIVVGMIGVGGRVVASKQPGSNLPGLLDIDFTGGGSIQILFDVDKLEKVDGEVQGVDIAEIRKKLAHLPDLAVSNVSIEGEPENIRFVINTSEKGIERDQKRKALTDVVEAEVKKVFGENAITAERQEAIADIGNGFDRLAAEERNTDARREAVVGMHERFDELFKDADDEKKRDEAIQTLQTRLVEVQKTAIDLIEEEVQKVFENRLTANVMTIEDVESIGPVAQPPAEKPPAEMPPAETPAVTEEPPEEAPAEEAPAEEAPTEEAPAEETPAEETAPADKPAEEASEKAPEEETDEEKPATEKPADEPKDGDQTRRGDLPSDSLWASATLTPMLVLQADADADTAEEDETTDEATDEAEPEKAEGAAEPEEAEEKSEDTAKAPATEDPDAPKEEPADSTDEGAEKADPDEITPKEPAAAPEEPAPVAQPDAAPAAPAGKADAFAGGTFAVLKFKQAINHDTLVGVFNDHFGGARISPRLDISNKKYNRDKSSIPYKEWNVKIAMPVAEAKGVFEAVKERVEGTAYFPASNTIGGKVAQRTQTKAIAALIASLLCIIGYIWVRFQRVVYGLAAVVALVHDVLVTLGILALSAYVAGPLGFLGIDAFKIGLPVLAAFLTIIGYSLNDTIVVFDRIREVKGKSPMLTADMINLSINQTLSRTLLTSITTLIVVLILYIWGGQGIHAFAFALVIGVLVGTYSSVFVASPALLWMSKVAEPKSDN